MNNLRNELKRSYSQIPNELITDLSLSSGALRVLLYLFTKPDDWNVFNKDICKQLGIYEDTLTKYWKELLASKWLRREPKRTESGTLSGGYLYRIGFFTESGILPEPEKTKDIYKTKPSTNNNLSTKTNTEASPLETTIIEESIKYLNAKTGAKYKATTPKTRTLIKARIKEGFTLNDFYTVIDKKVLMWSQDSKMQAYLRPETLFGDKFESYLNEIVTPSSALVASGAISSQDARSLETGKRWADKKMGEYK